MQRVDLRRNFGHELHGAGTGPDHGDALAAEVQRSRPLGRVEAQAGKALGAGNIGNRRAMQLAYGADHDVGFKRVAAGKA